MESRTTVPRFLMIIAVISLVFAAVDLCPGQFFHAESAYAASDAQPEYTEFSELKGKTVGMLTGAPFEELILSSAPDVAGFQYFSNIADMEMALKTNKIDAYLMNNAVATLAVNQDETLALFPLPLGETSFGIAFQKGSRDRDLWQEAYDKIPDETLQSLWEEWTGGDESAKSVPKQTWEGKNGRVHVAACDTMPPMSYRSGTGKMMGFDVEIILLMARELDIHVTFDGMEFASIMPAVQSGKDLMGAGSIVISDERREMVDFVEYYPASYVLLVRAVSGGGEGGFLTELKQSFYRTFIKEDRFEMVFSGLGLTILISILSGLIGILLAYGLVFARQRNYAAVNRLIAIYESLIAGIPAVVILMVLYYVVFGHFRISAVLVAIIGFALIFGARSYGVIWSTIGAVDEGQREAALALGYNEKQAFRYVILPQATPVYLPLIQAQFVTLVKETSVAGFITVLELTRAGDLIRSRTMEAFFPLISIALIYFILTWLLTKILNMMERRFENKRQERKIKGVD